MTTPTITRAQLRARRRSLGLSLDDVAAALGRGNAAYLSRWERHAPGVKLYGLTEQEYDAALTRAAKNGSRP